MASKAVVEYVGPIDREREGYTDEEAQEIIKEICDRIASGETLVAICGSDDIPARSTICQWLMADRCGFGGQYARARSIQAHLEDDECKHLADAVQADSDCVAKARLQIDTRKWRAERLNRRVYGNSTRHELEVRLGPPVTAAELPPGIAWLEGQLLESQPAEGPKPGDSGVGEE